jgi:cytidyltransferase-like protein
MKIGIYSGMFDPFHEGHRFVIEEACAIFDEVHMVMETIK